jgi:hypothetical protein
MGPLDSTKLWVQLDSTCTTPHRERGFGEDEAKFPGAVQDALWGFLPRAADPREVAAVAYEQQLAPRAVALQVVYLKGKF